MNLFRRKPIQERIKKKWARKTCSLAALEEALREAELMQLWVQYNDLYFMIGTASDYDRKIFFDKKYYIHRNTELSLFRLLNLNMTDRGFEMLDSFEELLSVRISDTKTLSEIWSECVIVGIDEADPDNDLTI